MGYTGLDDRIAHFNNLFSGRISRVRAIKKDGVKYLRAEDAKGKQIGNLLKDGASSHKLLAKQFPQHFSPPDGYTLGNANRLVPDAKRNVARLMTASDFKQIGLSKKEGYRLSKELKKKQITFRDPDQLRGLIQLHLNKQSKRIVKTIRENTHRIITDQLTHQDGTAVEYRNFEESHKINYIGRWTDIYAYHEALTPYAMGIINAFQQAKSRTIKIQMTQYCTMEKETEEGETVATDDIRFFCKVFEVLNENQALAVVRKAVAEIQEKVNTFLQNGSGWKIKKIGTFYVNIVRYAPLGGSSYIPLPEIIRNSRACINVQNKDNRCFLYSLLCGLHHDQLNFKHLDRLQQFDKLFAMYPDFDNKDMPMDAKDERKMRKYEKIINRGIWVLLYDGDECKKGIQTFRQASQEYEEKIILLLYSKGENNHFVWVKNLSALLAGQATKSERKMHYCLNCLARFYKEDRMKEHYQLCIKNETAKTKMSDKDELKFTNYAKQLRAPFAIYADGETLIKPNPCSYLKMTNSISTHEGCGMNYTIVSYLEKDEETGQIRYTDHGKVVKEFHKFGDGCVRKFLESLMKDCRDLYYRYLHRNQPIRMTDEDLKNYEIATCCHICGEDDFASVEEVAKWEAGKKKKGGLHPRSPVRDHDHLTGQYRGCAHSKCNLAYQVKNCFPVFFHNLKGFDSHFIVREIRSNDCEYTSVIPLNREKFLTLSLNYKVELYKKMEKTKKGKKTKTVYNHYNIQFLDSMSFLNTSLDKLSKTLPTGAFRTTQNLVDEYATCEEEKLEMFELIKRKGVYPYEYMDSWERFEETSLPPMKRFVSQLNHETKFYQCLSDKQKEDLAKDYEHAKKVWRVFRCRTMRDYHDLYLRTDVRILGDIFENFRNVSLRKFGLDPCHYVSLPGMAFDANLKKKNVKLHLFTVEERDMYLFCEGNKIGGISGTGSKRFAKANNKYIKGYDKSKKSTFLIYVDANALYGWAMMQKLPINDFKWVNPSKFEDVEAYLGKVFEDVDGERGQLLCVDADLPPELHDEQNDYPCFPENIEVTEEMLSDLQKDTIQMLRKHNGQVSTGVEKLVPNLTNKKGYTVHVKTLKLWVELGWKVTKVHRVLDFHQESWMKSFVEMCAQERAKASCEFEKDFFKLCANANYGKMLEDVRGRMDVKIETDIGRLQKYVNRPTLKNLPTRINHHGCYMVDLAKKEVTLNKPVYAGVSILHLSKYLMSYLYYKVLKPIYGGGLRMVYTDTDSFILEIETDDLYKDLEENETLNKAFDFSNYPKDHRLYTKEREKVPGLLKDETAGTPIREVVALRAKMYSVLQEDGVQKNTGKGIKKAVLKRLDHECYKRALFHRGDPLNFAQSASMTFIRSENHRVYTQVTTKQTLGTFDDKSWLLPDGISQYKHGHWRIDFVKMAKILDAFN